MVEYHGRYELLYSTSSLAFPFSFIQLDYSPVTWLTEHPSLGGGLTERKRTKNHLVVVHFETSDCKDSSPKSFIWILESC